MSYVQAEPRRFSAAGHEIGAEAVAVPAGLDENRFPPEPSRVRWFLMQVIEHYFESFRKEKRQEPPKSETGGTVLPA